MGDVPIYLKFAQSDPPSSESADFGRFRLIVPQPWELARKIQLSLIGSRPCAFQRAIDEPRTLPLSPAKGSSFVRSLLWAGVQPTLDPSAETFMAVQRVSSGRGGELVVVWGVCASYVGWRKGWVGVSSLSGISKRAPLGVAYCLAKPGLALIQCQPWPALLQRLATWLTLLQCLANGLSHIYLLQLLRRRDWYLDAANHGISNGHSL